APTYRGTVHLSSSDRQAILSPDAAFTAGDNGTHTFAAVFFTAGTQTLTATDTQTGTIVGTETITVDPAPVSSFTVAGYPSPTQRGDSHDFTVTAMDPYRNVVTGYTGRVHFTSDEDHADLPDDYTFTAADAGVHTFSAAFNRVGTFYLAATDTADPTITGRQSGIAAVDEGGGPRSAGRGGGAPPAAAGWACGPPRGGRGSAGAWGS